jgi:hypothetical protein
MGPKISLLVAQRKDDNREKMGFLYNSKKNWARLVPQGFFQTKGFNFSWNFHPYHENSLSLGIVGINNSSDLEGH